MKRFFALLMIILLIALMTEGSSGSTLWVNNITVNEHNMTWSYTETYSGADSIAFRVSIDTELGDNDSFLNAWELLKADKEMRKRFRSSIDKEFDVRINNETDKVEMIEIDCTLSPGLIGVSHDRDPVINRYDVTYMFKDSILNARSIWFMGQSHTSVTLVMPPGIDVINISGINNATVNISDHTEISGDFMEISKDRGEITLDLARNTSMKAPEIVIHNAQDASENLTSTNGTGQDVDVLSGIMDAVFVISGLVMIFLIYVFKLRKK